MRPATMKVLHLLIRFVRRQYRIDLDGDQRRDGQAQRARQLAADHLGDQCFSSLTGSVKLDHIRAQIIGFHQSR